MIELERLIAELFKEVKDLKLALEFEKTQSHTLNEIIRRVNDTLRDKRDMYPHTALRDAQFNKRMLDILKPLFTLTPVPAPVWKVVSVWFECPQCRRRINPFKPQLDKYDGTIICPFCGVLSILPSQPWESEVTKDTNTRRGE